VERADDLLAPTLMAIEKPSKISTRSYNRGAINNQALQSLHLEDLADIIDRLPYEVIILDDLTSEKVAASELLFVQL